MPTQLDTDLEISAGLLWVSYASSLQLNEDTKVLAELLYCIVIVLRVWFAGSLQRNEDKEVPGKVFSYLYRCPLGLVCWQPPNG
jgi:hypothetical protein